MLNIYNELFLYLLISLGFNIALFIPAFIFKTDKLTDLSYSLTFIFLVVTAFIRGGEFGALNIVMLGFVLIWAIRLGGYLFIRINKIKKDDRFDQIRNNFWKFFGFWFIQGLSVWVIMLPAIIFYILPATVTSESEMGVGAGLWLIATGALIYLIGIITESVADYQKFNYIKDSKKEGRERHWIDVGLWKYSRHPNYLGEITLWIGIYLFAITRMNLLQAIIAFVGPLYIFTIIRFFSGVPMLEKKANERYGDREDYQEYIKETGLLLPKL